MQNYERFFAAPEYGLLWTMSVCTRTGTATLASLRRFQNPGLIQDRHFAIHHCSIR